MLKRVGPVVLLALAVALTLAACGGNDTVKPKPGPEVDVRNGTWSLSFTTSWSGADSCADREEMMETLPDTLLCSFDLVGTEAYNFDCESSIQGENVSFDCTALIRDIDPCKFIGHIEGTGTVNDTTIVLTASVYVEVSGPDEVCSLYSGLVDPCVETVVITGHWVSAERAEDCPAADVSKTSAVRILLGRAAAIGFESY